MEAKDTGKWQNVFVLFFVSTNIGRADSMFCVMQVPMYLIEHAGGRGRSSNIKMYTYAIHLSTIFHFNLICWLKEIKLFIIWHRGGIEKPP